MRVREIWLLSGLTAASLVVLAATGAFVPIVTPDTASYFDLGDFPDFLARTRTPLYGWLMRYATVGDRQYALVPVVQILTYLAAVWLLVAELKTFGLSGVAVLTAAAALLFANALFFAASLVHAEFLATACGLLGFAGVVRLAGPQPRRWAYVLILAGAGSAYVLRPSLLPLVIVLPLTFIFLRAIRGERAPLARAGAILGVTAIPLLAVSLLRSIVVGDPGLVSFGGFAMSGLAGLMLSDDVVARLPDDLRSLATQILAARRAREEAGEMIGIPLNSSGVRSYYSAALGYFDVLARTYDNVVYDVVLPTRQPGEPWVAFNRRLQRFSFAVVLAAPDRYAAWIVGAIGRLIGHAVTTNPVFVFAAGLAAVAWSWRTLCGRGRQPASAAPLDLPVLVVLAVAWLIGAGAMSVLVTFPALRYVETASLLLAAPALYGAVLAVAPGRARAPRPRP